MTRLKPEPADKFTFGLWTVGNRGRDPFGESVRPPLDPVTLRASSSRSSAPTASTSTTTTSCRSTRPPPSAIASSATSARRSRRPACTCRWRRRTCSPIRRSRTAPSRRTTRASAPTPCRRRCARWTSASELGAHTYVFWGGREGAEVDAGKDPVEAIKRFREAIDFLCEYASDQSYDAAVRARGQAERAARRHLLPDDGRLPGVHSRRWRTRRWSASTRKCAHEQMAGLNFFHAVAQAIEAGKLFHIDLNDQKPGRLRSGPALRHPSRSSRCSSS